MFRKHPPGTPAAFRGIQLACRLCTVLLIAPAIAGDAKMVAVPGKDVKGEVFKRLGLPNQAYCWEQCLDEPRCTATRWAVIAGSVEGQCQLISGPLTFVEPHEIKTEDGQQIRVTVGRRESRDK